MIDYYDVFGRENFGVYHTEKPVTALNRRNKTDSKNEEFKLQETAKKRTSEEHLKWICRRIVPPRLHLPKKWICKQIVPPRQHLPKQRLPRKSFFDCSHLDLSVFPFEDVSQRLHSYFGRWPPNAKVWPSSLASAGFYYLGENLDLQCTSCSIRTNIKDWNPLDNPIDVHAKLNPKCDFLKSIGYTNTKINSERNFEKCPIKILNTQKSDIISGNDVVPKGNLDSGINANINPPVGVLFKYPKYSSLEKRLKTFEEHKWKYGTKQSSEVLAICGYFYTGEADIVRCFCCDLGLAEWDSSDDPWTEHSRHSPKCWFLIHEKGHDFVEKIQTEWRKVYNPKHKAYEDKISRMTTFYGQWRTDIEQTAEMLSDAGFFYEGEEDVVRCHYCDGGLRNWEPGDVPWEEHARWFPFCKFVIKMKGRDYIEEIKAKYEDTSEAENEENPPPATSNPHMIKSLLEMGFPVNDATYAINKFVQDEGSHNCNIEDLLGILIEKHEEEKIKQEISARSKANEDGKHNQDPATILEINMELKKSFMCVRCQKEERCILFPNCGHRVLCESCANVVDYCPQCDKKIKSRIKTFLS